MTDLGVSIDPPGFVPELLLPEMRPPAPGFLIDGIPWSIGYDFSRFDGVQVLELEGRAPPLTLFPNVDVFPGQSTGEFFPSAIGIQRRDRAVRCEPLAAAHWRTGPPGAPGLSTPPGASAWYRVLYLDPDAAMLGGFANLCFRRALPFNPANFDLINWARDAGRANFTVRNNAVETSLDGFSQSDGGAKLIDCYVRGSTGDVTICSNGSVTELPGAVPAPVRAIDDGFLQVSTNADGALLFIGMVLGIAADALFSPTRHISEFAQSGLSA